MAPVTILNNARIYTLDREFPRASSLVIADGYFLEVGKNWTGLSEPEDFRGKVVHIDLGGKVVLPGFVDSHLHLKNYALSLKKVDCETSTRYECLRRVAERASSTEAGKWILGHGWNQTRWEDGYGTKEELDEVTDAHPVYLTAKSLHAAWANSRALRIGEIDKDTPNPEGGVIQRQSDGIPTGILFERAMELVSNVVPAPEPCEVQRAILDAQVDLFSMGLTGVHDFDRRECFIVLQGLHQAGMLSLRVHKSIPLEDLEFAIQLGIRSGFGDDILRIGSVKIFADGALGQRTAAMIEAYAGEPENRGMLLFDAESLVEVGRIAVENGLSLAVHAIGDLANHEVLNGFERLREYENTLFGTEARYTPEEYYADLKRQFKISKRRLRHRIEHVQLIHPDDMGRLAKLDVIASMQPVHATSDMLMADKYWGERAANSYAWNSLQSCNVKLAFGSDAPVESPNPFWGIHAAVTRRNRDRLPLESGWYPQQCLSVEQVIRAYTTGAAYASGTDDRLGLIKTGYLADLIILDVDPFTCDPDHLWKIEPVATMVGGKWVYGIENLV